MKKGSKCEEEGLAIEEGRVLTREAGHARRMSHNMFEQQAGGMGTTRRSCLEKINHGGRTTATEFISMLNGPLSTALL